MGDHHGARVVLATHNRGKLAELRDLLAAALPGADVERLVVDAAAAGAPDVVEDGTTFEANALLKARAAAAATGLIAVADDSGLAVDVLGGSPGVFSARWAGPLAEAIGTEKDEANNRLLLAQLADVPDEHRAAAFVCAAALVTPDGREVVREGRCDGLLARAPRGRNGFGYDPLLVRPDGRTLAEHTSEEKNAVSHRGAAFRALGADVLRLLP